MSTTRLAWDEYFGAQALLIANRAKKASHHNRVRNYWGNLSVARLLHNLMVLKRCQNQTFVVEPSD